MNYKNYKIESFKDHYKIIDENNETFEEVDTVSEAVKDIDEAENEAKTK